jgi:hypothetical protein
MLTIKQTERHWQLKAYERMIDELCLGRAEAVGGIRQLLRGPVVAAALTVIRMGELLQAHQPFVIRMLKFLIASQQADGGFGDAPTTALALRALASNKGAGESVDRALVYLDHLQRDDGEWPREPLRRMPGDQAVTAFVLLQLVESRLDRAEILVHRTLDRLVGDDAQPASQADRQLLPLRRKIAARNPALVGSWS